MTIPVTWDNRWPWSLSLLCPGSSQLAPKREILHNCVTQQLSYALSLFCVLNVLERWTLTGMSVGSKRTTWISVGKRTHLFSLESLVRVMSQDKGLGCSSGGGHLTLGKRLSFFLILCKISREFLQSLYLLNCVVDLPMSSLNFLRCLGPLFNGFSLVIIYFNWKTHQRTMLYPPHTHPTQFEFDSLSV